MPLTTAPTEPARLIPMRRQMRQEHHSDERTQQLMSQIHGEDHQALAQLLDYRVTKLEGKVDTSTSLLSSIDAKIDAIAAHGKEVTERFDKHLEEHARPAPKPWQQPKWLNSLALLILASSAWVAAAGRDLSAKVFAVFSHWFGG